MNTNIKSVLAAASLLALSALTANAQLITGSVTGLFGTAVGGTTVLYTSNGVPNQNTPFATGANQVGFYTGDQNAGSTSQAQTSVVFNGSFPNNLVLDLGSSALQSIGQFTWVNGNTSDVTTADTVQFVYSLTFSSGFSFTSSSLTLSLDQPDAANLFTISSSVPSSGSFVYGGNGLTYAYSLSYDGATAVIPEAAFGVNASATNNLYIRFQAVPEPSTYALFGVVGLMGLVAVRRFRSSKKVA